MPQVYKCLTPLIHVYTLAMQKQKDHQQNIRCMKKIITLAAALLVSATILNAEPESKVETSFKAMFPNANNVKWHQDKTGYLVSFTQSGTDVKIMYDNKGKFLQSLRYYGEKDLPTNILLAVKNKYHDRVIHGVVECTTTNDVSYHIVLSGGTMPENIVAYSNGTVKKDIPATEDDAE